MLAVSERCLTLAAGNVPAASLEEQDFSPILRAREETATPDAVADHEHAMLARLDMLGRHQEPGSTAGPEPDTAPGHEQDGAA